jgi:uncharacterized protein YabN with tetrapyrrole methylase and pyrophosphatase domain
MEAMPANIDLYIIGAGVAFPHHLTLQAIESLSSSVCICTNIPNEYLDRLPSNIGSKCKSLWPLYRESRIRAENYRDVREAVVREVETNRPTAWLTPGHPLVFDSVSTDLLKIAATRRWNTCVVPGISSIDTLLADIQYDPANGITIHDATSIVYRNVPLATSVPLLLLQIGSFFSEHAHLTLKENVLNLTPLRNYLVQYFPNNHECVIVHSAPNVALLPELTWTTVDRLPSLQAQDYAGANLFIPAIGRSLRPASTEDR